MLEHLRSLNEGERVRVYKNLNKDIWSVKSMEKPDYGYVIAHKTNVILEDCNFIVQASGKQAALENQERNVHAFIDGKVLMKKPDNCNNMGRIIYNPFQDKDFTLMDVHGVENLDFIDVVEFNEEGCFGYQKFEFDKVEHICDVLQDEIGFWSNTNDLYSPTHRTDIREFLRQLDIKEDDRESLIENLNNILNVIRNYA